MAAIRWLAVAAAALIWATPAWGLSVEQVLALRKAGVSDQTIRAMISTELAVARQGGVGRYVVKQGGGREVIVYQAASPQGAAEVEYENIAPAGGLDPVSLALGAERREAAPARAETSPSGKAAPAKPRAQPREYSLHLTSHQRERDARAAAAGLQEKGLPAWVTTVDLGDKGVWHRVMVGRYADRAQAETAGRKLQEEGKIGSFLALGL